MNTFSIQSKSRTKFFVLLLLLCGVNNSFAQFVIDESYAHQGKLRLHFDDYNEAIDVLNAGNDSLLVACNTSHIDTASYNTDIVLTKILSDGNIDLNFAQSGTLRFDFEGADISTVKSFLKRSDGKIVLLGNGYALSNASYNPFCIALISEMGKLDSTFGINGTLKIVFAGQSEIPVNIKSDSNNRILFCGSTIDTADTHSEVPVIARMNGNGILDNNFGFNGKVFLRISGGVLQSRSDRHLIGGGVNDFVFLPDGKILCAGGYSNGNNIASFFAMLNSDGSVDTTFFDKGFLGIDFSPFSSNYVSKLVEWNGKIIFAVRSDETVSRNFEYGVLDLQNETYETDAVDFFFNEDVVKDMLMTTDGRILFTGYSVLPQHSSSLYFSDYFSVAQLTGSQYPFSNSPQLFAFDSIQQNGANSFAELSSSKIICAGFVNTSLGSEAALMKLKPALSSVENNLGNDRRLEVYPIPSANFVTLKFPFLNFSGTIELSDLNGKIVLQKNMDSQNEQLNISKLSSGTYFLKAVENSSNTKWVSRIVKM